MDPEVFRINKIIKNMEKIRIEVGKLPRIPNVCRQILREVWKSKNVSIAHVVMRPGNTSLIHKHKKITELYYILDGFGEMEVGEKKFKVKQEMLVEIKANMPHQLKNTGRKFLKHLVISSPAFDSQDVILIK